MRCCNKGLTFTFMQIDGQQHRASVLFLQSNDGQSFDTSLDLWWRGVHFRLALPTKISLQQANIRTNAVVSPMPGKVLRVLVREGQPIRGGDIVAVLEAMKMEHTIVAPLGGFISSLSCVEGTQV